MATRGKPWTLSECYFAVWVFDKLDQEHGLDKKDLYENISYTIRRSVASIELKVKNVSSCHSEISDKESHFSKLNHYQHLLKDVYTWYWKDRQSARDLYDLFCHEYIFGEQNIYGVPSSILKHRPLTISSQKPIFFEEIELNISEGLLGTSRIKSRSRSIQLIEKGREYFKSMEPNHELRCYACDYTRPDSIHREIIQLHHCRPISQYDKEHVAIKLNKAIENLVPLCPTCHRIAHTASPPLSVRVIKSIIQL